MDRIVAKPVFEKERIVAAAAEHAVGIGPTIKQVVAVPGTQAVRACPTDKRVRADVIATQQRVVAVTAHKAIRAVAAVDIVEARATLHGVVADPAFHGVVAGATQHGVVACAAIDAVGPGAAIHGVIAVRPGEPVIVITTQNKVIANATGQAVRADPAVNGICSIAPRDRVGPGLAKDRIITRTGQDTVIARARQHAVIVGAVGMIETVDHVAFGITGIARVDDVIACRALDDIIGCRNANGDQFGLAVQLGGGHADQRDRLPAREGQDRVAVSIICHRHVIRVDRCPVRIGQAGHIQLVIGRAVARVGHVEIGDGIRPRPVGQQNRVTTAAQNDAFNLGESDRVSPRGHGARFRVAACQVDGGVLGQRGKLKRVARGFTGLATDDRVAAEAVIEPEAVVAALAIHEVVVSIAVYAVIVSPGIDRVIAVAAQERVIANIADDLIVARTAVDIVRAARGKHVIAIQRVIARAAQQCVGAIAAKDRVIACASHNTVVARACEHTVIVRGVGVIGIVDHVAFGVAGIARVDRVTTRSALDDKVGRCRRGLDIDKAGGRRAIGVHGRIGKGAGPDIAVG